jgi:glyoxalase family protein
MAMATTSGIHHVTMVSADARRTLHFYRGVMGLELVKQTVNFDSPSSYHLYFGDAGGRPGTLLTFFEWPGAGPGRPGIGGVHHVALGVADEEGLLMWKRWLTDHGVPVSGPYDRGYFTSIYFRDPDGQILEIATSGPGYEIDEERAALGRELKLPPQRIVRGHRDEAAIASLTHPEPLERRVAEMKLSGIHHVSGITDDLARVGDFLEEALGLKLVKQTTNRDDPDTLHFFWGQMDEGGVVPGSAYTLFGWPSSWNQAVGGVGQTHHIAFRASDEQEQLAFQDRLRSLGVTVSDVLDRSYFRSIYFRAPDGQLMEIATDGPGFSVDEDPSRLGSALQLPGWLEAERATIEEQLQPLH